MSNADLASPAFGKILLKHLKEVQPLLEYGWTIAGPAIRDAKKNRSK